MPIFEYQCQACGQVTSFLENRNHKGPHVCESCGSKKTKKMFSAFAAHSKQGKQVGAPQGGCGSGACGQGRCGMMGA